MSAIDLVIFDCDGVLVDSETITNQVFTRAAHAAGMICLGFIGGTLKDEEGLAAEGAMLISDLRQVENYL